MDEIFNVENMDAEETGDSPEPKKAIRWTIIIPIIVLIIIVIAVAVIIIFLKFGDNKDDKCVKGDGDKCLTCDGEKCGSCNEGYKLVDGKCIKEDKCIKGDGDKCLTCDGEKCGSCNERYKLVDGSCILNFSFRAIYETKSENENLTLIHDLYKDKYY